MQRSLEWVADAVRGELVVDADGSDQREVGIYVELEFVTTDSRDCVDGSLYVARRGESADGHDYCAPAVLGGASALIVEQIDSSIPVPQIRVEDSTIALGELAKAHLEDLREHGDIKVLGVTGSVGKTTTKDLLARITSHFGPTIAPKLSFNNEVGCPLTVLRADENTQFLVLEMGASGPGHIAYLTQIAPLDVALVLMVGRAHLGGFGSVESLTAAKSELIQGLVDSGVAVLNYDDPNVWGMRDIAPSAVVTFSAQGADFADYRVKDTVLDQLGRASFTVVAPEQSADIALNLVGVHQVSNALAAAAAAGTLGLDLDEVATILAEARPDSPHRMDVRELSIQEPRSVDFTLIDDSYNANPDSMKAAFAVASRLADEKRRILMVLGEMLELGEEGESIHREVGDSALQSKPALIVQLGENAKYVDDFDKDRNPTLEVSNALDSDEALRLVLDRLQSGDIVLVKGANGSGSWKVADALIGRDRL